MKPWLLIFRMLAVVVAAACLQPVGIIAKDFYVAQISAGANTGVDAADAYAVSWLNASTNWGIGPSKISPGDTVHLCGVLTNAVSVAGSGTMGNPITIYFEPGAQITSPAGWPGNAYNTGAITVNKMNFITIDGGVNGNINCTANGTGLANTNYSAIGVNATSASYFTVQNLTVGNMYVRVRGTDENAVGVGIEDTAKLNVPYSNCLVSNCIVHDSYEGIYNDYPAGSPGATNIEICFCQMYNCNWTGALAGRGNGSVLSGAKWHDNFVHDWICWDDTLSNKYHHNGFFGFAIAPDTMSNIWIYNNTFGPNFTLGGHATSGVFFQYQFHNAQVFNNVFQGANSSDSPADGFIYMNPVTYFYCTNYVFNNTFVNGGGNGINFTPQGSQGSNSPIQTVVIENNIMTGGVKTYIAIYANATVAAQINWNLGFGCPNPYNAYGYSSTGSLMAVPFAGWQNLGFDLNGQNVDPQLGSGLNVIPETPVISSGANLSSFFLTDKIGSPRPTNGPWDLGAYCAPPLTPPTNLQIVPP